MRYRNSARRGSGGSVPELGTMIWGVPHNHTDAAWSGDLAAERCAAFGARILIGAGFLLSPAHRTRRNPASDETRYAALRTAFPRFPVPAP